MQSCRTVSIAKEIIAKARGECRTVSIAKEIIAKARGE